MLLNILQCIGHPPTTKWPKMSIVWRLRNIVIKGSFKHSSKYLTLKVLEHLL